MKLIAIVFVSVIGLFGFVTNGFAQDTDAAAKQQAHSVQDHNVGQL